MSTMEEITKKSDAELTAYIAEKREELRAFRFNIAGAATRNTKAARAAKQEVARALTEQNRRARAAAKEVRA